MKSKAGNSFQSDRRLKKGGGRMANPPEAGLLKSKLYIRRSTVHFIILAALVASAILSILFLSDLSSGKVLCINEVMPNNMGALADADNSYTEWIELYNGTATPVNLEGYGLSDDIDDPFIWTFPDVTIESGAYLLVYTNGKALESSADYLCTNFHLRNEGETVVLTDPGGYTIDQVSYSNAQLNIPWGRKPDGKQWAILNNATPGHSNASSNVSQYIPALPPDALPVFDKEGGYYDSPFYLELSSPSGGTIYYTLDGSDPDFSSSVYDGPIRIENRSSEPNLYANIKTSNLYSYVYKPNDAPVQKGTVVKAAVCRDGIFSQKTATHTYFVGLSSSLMTVSLASDPDNLFDYRRGIYVPGITYGFFSQTAWNPSYSQHGRQLGNYSLTGKAAERPAHIEFFDENGERVLAQSIGIRTSGGLASSASYNKSLRLYASRAYDSGETFDFPSLFPETENKQDEYKQLVLRSSSNFCINVLCDAYTTTLFLDEGLGVQAYRPAVLYIDGEYWGLTAVRERIDEKMIASHYGLDPDQIILLKYSHGTDRMEIKSGDERDRREYLAFFDEALANTESDAGFYTDFYDRMEEAFDLDNLIRCYIARIFFACRDWPDNNIRVFRTDTDDGTAGTYQDGKWRFLLYDMDYSCQDYEHNTLQFAMGNGQRGYGWQDNETPAEWSTALFKCLMQEERFRTRFLEIYTEYRNTILCPEYLTARFDEMVAEVYPELERHADRWALKCTLLAKILHQQGSYDGLVEREDVESELSSIRDFLEKRPSYMDRFMEEFYSAY